MAGSTASSPAVPILGVEAFSPPSPLLPNKHRRSLDNQHASSCQRINDISLYAEAEAEGEANDDDETESESKSDGTSPAPAAADEVSRQLAKAKELIERTKQKMESKEKAVAAAAAAAVESEDDDTDEATSTASAAADDEDEVVVPFFAVDPTAAEKRREMVTKTKDEESGLITTDGDKMASLADGEKWESRGLYDLFENEIEEDEAAKAKEARASRDVARSMMNLKMIMNKQDFDFIFDKKNRFIGED